MVKAKSAETSTHAEISKTKKSVARIDIPESSKVPKAIFRDRPALEVVLDIKRHIRETREPWTDPRHTHTKPPKGAKVVYLGEFDLPTGYLTPCPCCSMSTPKFGHGMIGWFPEEFVIRNVGPQCFRTLNEEGHKSALEAYNIEKQATQDRDYLLERKDLVEDLINVADELVEIGRAADAFWPSLSDAIHKGIGVPLSENTRDGQMKIWADVADIKVGKDGEIKRKVNKELVSHAVMDGFSAIRPGRRDLADALVKARDDLRSSGAFSREYIVNAADATKTEIASKMRKAITTIRQNRNILDKELSFLRAENVNRIKHWARRPDAQLQFDFDVDRGVVTVGKRGTVRTIIIPEALRRRSAPKFEDI